MAWGSYLLRAPEEDLSRWREAAEKEGMTFAAFVREALEARSGDWAVFRTATGRTLTNAEIEGYVAEAEAGYDPDDFVARPLNTLPSYLQPPGSRNRSS